MSNKIGSTNKKGFTLVDAILAISILFMGTFALFAGVSAHKNQVNIITINNQINGVIQDEIVLLQVDKHAMDKKVGNYQISYQIIREIEIAKGKIVIYQLTVEDEESGIKKQANISVNNL